MVDEQVEKQLPQEKIKVPAMVAAILRAQGIKAAAGRILGVDWKTVAAYIKKYPTCRLAYDQAVEGITDLARGNLIRAIIGGDVAESKWWLTKKDPEFKETVQQEIVGAGGKPFSIRVMYDPPPPIEDGHIVDGEARILEDGHQDGHQDGADGH